MLGAALHLVPILGAEAEKNKTLFYVCGGVLAAWAVILAVGIGLRRPEFPKTLRGERTVIGITVVLVLATTSAAVIVSGPRSEAKRAAETSPASTTPTGAPLTMLELMANPSGQLTYDAKLLRAKAGVVSIAFTNNSPLEHNVTIAQGSKVLGATPTFTGGKRTLALHLKPGTYTFYCSVPGHRQAGMEGTLKVSS